MMRSSSQLVHDRDRTSKTKDHENESNHTVNDDDDYDWMIKQAEVWAAAEAETKSGSAITHDDTSGKKSSVNTTRTKSPPELHVKSEQPKISKKRKLPVPLDRTPNDATTSGTTKSLNNKHLPSNQPQQQLQLQGPQLYSLHITQLSYDATDFDIREHFIRHGCMNIPSIRLVYDYHDAKGDGLKQKQKKFRGVAFVDIYMDTYESYAALIQQLHGSIMLQRKINVRPVKSKVELASIVQQTKAYVNQQIQIEKEKKKLKLSATNDGVAVGDKPIKKKKSSDGLHQGESKTKVQKKKTSKIMKTKEAKDKKSVNDIVASRAGGTSGRSRKEKIESSASSPQEKQQSTVETKVKHGSTTANSKSTTLSTKMSNNTTKLTKQQRNRKAAILMQKRRAR